MRSSQRANAGFEWKCRHASSRLAQLRHAQDAAAPAGDHRRIEHHNAPHPLRFFQRGHERQITAQRMADEPHRLLIRAADVVDQLLDEMRPVLRDRKARIVCNAFDVAHVVVVGEFGENRPVSRGRKAVRVRKMNDVFQLRLSPFCFRFRAAGEAVRHLAGMPQCSRVRSWWRLLSGCVAVWLCGCVAELPF
jgi:hypothetical protein